MENKNFSVDLNSDPNSFIDHLLTLMGEDILSQQAIANELSGLKKSQWKLIKKVARDEAPTPIAPLYEELGLKDIKTVSPSNVCWNSMIRYDDNHLVIESEDGNIYIYQKNDLHTANFSARIKKLFNR